MKYSSFLHTCITEDPCGDVGPCAHDVLHIQTGLQTSLSSSLSAHHSVHHRVVLEATTKQAHELSQVQGVIVLLQELKREKQVKTDPTVF